MTAYTVLARKYRSQTLDEVVGQEPIVETLRNAIGSDRVHHGYLFSGTRGVGKTSTARILAKCLNCLQTDQATTSPCGTCESCTAIASGQDIDVIEIDAASNTGVDNIRDLRNNANFRPARSRYKIYIIDEVHMLSTGAFNALLKTLEEPPNHVKFILATTEQHKVPATIQSRVQRFEFRSLTTDAIVQELSRIVINEAVRVDDAVLRRVGKLANGSMRDGLSLLDQLLSLGSAHVTTATAEEMLPTAHDERLSTLVDAVLARDAAVALGLTEEYLVSGQTLERFVESLIEQIRTTMIVCVCGSESDLIDIPEQAVPHIEAQANGIEPTVFVYLISILEELRRQIRTSGAGRALTDAAIVHLTNWGEFCEVDELLQDMDVQGDTSVREQNAHPSHARTHKQEIRSKRVSSNEAPLLQKSVTSQEMKDVRSDPLVQGAIQVFDGMLVNVQRTQGAHGTHRDHQTGED